MIEKQNGENLDVEHGFPPSNIVKKITLHKNILEKIHLC